jgi:hypothetical protein
MSLLPRLLPGLGLALCCALPAHAARPFVTEDAGVLERGSCEFEAAYGNLRQRGSPTQRRWWLQPVCGVGARTQIALGGGVSTADGVRSKGLALLGKTWLTTPSDDGPNLAIAYGASMAREPGDRWRHDGKLLNLVGTLRSGESSYSANLGWARDVLGKRSSTTWSLGWERPVLEGLEAGVDLFGDDREAPWLNLGLRWTVSEGVWLDAALARQTNAARARALNLGLRLGW